MQAMTEEGRAYFAHCPRCDEVIITAQIDGLETRVSRWWIPYEDARVLSKYVELVVHIRVGFTQLYAASWGDFGYGPPTAGTLHPIHICWIRP